MGGTASPRAGVVDGAGRQIGTLTAIEATEPRRSGMKPQASALSEDEYDLVQNEVFQTLLQIEEDQECVADGLTPISLEEVESIDPCARVSKKRPHAWR